MAKTYYNYAERDVNSMIDWSQVGKNLTDMLTEQASLRQSKRQALEKASNDFGKVVSDTPTGLSESWNNRTLDFANNVQEQRKLDDSLLAQGLMPLNMYLKKRELSKMGTEKFYGISKKMQAEFESSLNRMKEGKSMEREQLNMELIENLASSGMPMLHDVTGELIIAGMIDGPDGVKVIDPNKNNHMTVDDYDRLVTQKFDKYDFFSAAKASADLIGDYSTANSDEATRSRGLSYIIEKSGAKFRDDINAYVDDFVNTIKANPLHMESVLTDTMGKYKTTYDTDQAASDPNYILLVKDGKTNVARAEFTDAQQKDFEEFAKRQLFAMADEKIKITSAGYKPSSPTELARYNQRLAQQQGQQAFETIMRGVDGDEASLQIFANSIGAESIKFADDQKSATVVYSDGSTKTVNTANKESLGAAFAQLQGLSDQAFRDYAKTQNFSGAVDVEKFGDALTKIKGVTVAPQYVDEPAKNAFERMQKRKLQNNVFVPGDVDKTAGNLKAIIGSIPGLEGIKISKGGWLSGQTGTVIIKDDGGTELLKLNMDQATPEQVDAIINGLVDLSYNRTLSSQNGARVIEQITEGQRSRVRVTTGGIAEQYNDD